MKDNELDIDLHDRVLDAYYGKMGEKLMKDTQYRIHWICNNVKGKKILDVGCSQGIVPILLGREGKNVIGIDISQKAIDEANEQLSKEEVDVQENVNFFRANFMLKDFGEEKFDTIIIAEVLEHLTNPQEFIDKAKELLVDNGTLIITVPFGINDFIDHKKTYYFFDLYEMLYKKFIIKDVSILGKWIGTISNARLKDADGLKAINIDLIQKSEEAFYVIERELVDKNKELYTQLNMVNMKYRTATKTITEQKEEIDKINRKYKEATKTITEQKEEIDKINRKYKEATKTITEQKEEIDNINNMYETLLSQISYKDKTIKDIKKQINSLKYELSQAQKYKKYLHEAKESASFRLGHLLIHETKSIKDILSLPKKIMNIKSNKSKHTLINMSSKKKLLKIENNILSKASISFHLEEDKKINELKIACIMDPFTFGSYSQEAIFLQLTPDEWMDEITKFSPDLLFIESAWRGKDELWWNSVGKKCDELVDIVNYCKKNNIPTVFWNKEDPVHFDTFINTASIFDFIFTTDIDMIDKYKAVLQHEQVYLLPFACQPTVNNPIEKYTRKDAFCFAGAYYARYPERTKDLDEFMLHLPKLKPIEIYDRNYGKDDSAYMFPEQFKPFIVGTLPFEEIDKAYKGYNYAINLNSVKQSQSMFARRVFEVLASNTITVSNFSKAVRLLFGDLVITSDSGLEIIKRVSSLQEDKILLKKHKLIALRKVLSEHTYKDRLTFVASQVFNKEFKDTSPHIQMVCFVDNEEQYEQCLEIYKKQNYDNKTLLLIEDSFKINSTSNDVKTINIKQIENFDSDIYKDIDIDYVSFINTKDYYGKNYLTDLALATSYFKGSAIGKGTYYTNIDEKLILHSDGTQYTIINSLPLYSSIIKIDNVRKLSLKTIKQFTEISQIGDLECLSIDEFNYCENGYNLPKKDLAIIEADNIKADIGIPCKKLIDFSKKIEAIQLSNLDDSYISSEALIKSIDNKKIDNVSFEIKNDQVIIKSTMSSDKHQNIYNPNFFEISSSGLDTQQEVYLNMGIGLDIQLIVVYSDVNKQKISHQFILPNRNDTLNIPSNAKWIHFGFRVKGSGNAILDSLELSHRVLNPPVLMAQAEHLVLTNIYPSYDNLYRNGFVHARVKAYQKEGINVDVFSLQDNKAVSYYEFENINVTNGSKEALRTLLQNNSYKTILVHFLDENMWDVIKDFIDDIKVYVWIHGSEIQPWYRRKHNFQANNLDKIKLQSDKKVSFWKKIVNNQHSNLKLVFVSQYLANTVMKDLNLSFLKNSYFIVHNFINTNLFKYIPKSVEQRKKILSIRPYANANYANDLSVKAILELSKKTYFKELEFHMMGDGVLFDETLKPLYNFNNVKITKCFLSHNEIAKLHKEYGVFLSPTRMDTQGVSRDEAMSSGLVPITNRVAAIPEFVDEECGILVDAEDAHGLAEGIDKLYNNPDLFIQMSEAAAKRVRNQSSYEYTIKKEIKLFNV